MPLHTKSSQYRLHTETFASVSTGTTVDISTSPLVSFTVSIVPTGAVLTWNVILEGSIDGTNFTTILTHTNIIGANISVFSGTTLYPSLYFRAKCTAVALGSGTNLVVTILGVS